MVKLPTLQPRGATIRGPVSSITAQDVANPYQQIADAIGTMGKALEAKEMEDAQTEGQNAVYRDESGTLQVDRKSNFSATGRAYNRAAQQGYMARLAGDIRARGSSLADDAKGNVDVFNSSWKAFQDQTLVDVPKEYRGAVRTMLETSGPELALGVSERKRKADLQEFEGNIKAEIKFLDDDMSALARSGGTASEAYKAKQAQLSTLWNELADNPDFAVGAKEAQIALKQMESRHMSEAMLGTVERALETGGIAEARAIGSRILTDETLSLSPQERRQYSGMINERINGYVAQRKVDLKPVQDQSKVIQERLKTGVGLDSPDVDDVARQLAAGGDLSGAVELYNQRAVQRTLTSIRLADNPTQVRMAEAAFSLANGGDGILAAIQGVESEGNPTAESSAGASGLMQVMPGTGAEIAAELGDSAFPVNGTEEEQKAYLKNADVSTRYGTHYFNKMMTRYGGDREAALIAYNGGQQRADAWLRSGRDDSVIPKESADYYKKVLARTENGRSASPEEVTAAKSFLMGRTDKESSHIDGMDNNFAVKIARLFEAAPPGIKEKLGIYSGARSAERQAEIIAENASKYGIDRKAWERDVSTMGAVAAGEKWAGEFKRTGMSEAIGKPGGSYHQHGTAADLSFEGASLSSAPKEVVDWLHNNAGKFGLKFPLGNENWHIEDDGTRGGKGTTVVPPEVIKEYRTEMTADAKSLFEDIKTGADGRGGMDKGFTPAISDLNLLTRQLAVVDDQDFKREVSDYFTSQSAITAMQGMAPAQVESLMSSLLSDASGGATVAQQQIITGMQQAEDARQKALTTDPIGYAAQRGMIPAPPPLDLQQPDTWGTTFQALQRGVDIMQARGEVGNIPALRPEMMTQVSRMLETATPADAMGMLGAMSQNLRPETYKATLAKLYANGQGKAAAVAGALAPHNPAAAEGVLRGQVLLTENPLLAPRKTDDNRVAIDELLPPSTVAPGFEASRQFLLESATARYADLSHQAGDTSGELNDERMQRAITEVTGGLVDMNGSDTIAPRYGMTQDEFDKVLAGITDKDLAGAVTASGLRVTARNLISGGRLRAIADGQYLLEFGNPESPTYVLRQPSPGTYRQSSFVLDLRGR